MRGWPSWNTSRTPLVAQTAPKAMMPEAHVMLFAENAVASGSAGTSCRQGSMPVSTIATALGMTVQMARLAIMAMGMSRWGFLVSSAAVDTASKPM